MARHGASVGGGVWLADEIRGWRGVIRLERCHMSIQLITGSKVVLRKWKDRSQTLNEVICA